MSYRAIVTLYSCGVPFWTRSFTIKEPLCVYCKDDKIGCNFYYCAIPGNDRMRCVRCGNMIPALPGLSEMHLTTEPNFQSNLGRINEVIRLISLKCPKCNDRFHGLSPSGWLSRKTQEFLHSSNIGNEPEICPASELHQRLNVLQNELRKEQLAYRPKRKFKETLRRV